MLTQLWQQMNLAGRLNLGSTECVKICGDGSPRTPQDSAKGQMYSIQDIQVPKFQFISLPTLVCKLSILSLWYTCSLLGIPNRFPVMDIADCATLHSYDCPSLSRLDLCRDAVLVFPLFYFKKKIITLDPCLIHFNEYQIFVV